MRLGELGFDGALLPGDFAQQGRELLVAAVILLRVLQIQGVHRRHDASGHAVGQNGAENEHHDDHHRRRLQHRQQQRPDGVLRHSQAQHAAVRQARCAVEGLLRQGGAHAAGFAAAACKRLGDLRPIGVVFHGGGIRLVVIDHRAVGFHQGDPAAAVFEGVQVIFPLGLHALGDIGRLGAEILLGAGDKLVVEKRQQHRRAAHQHRCRHQADGLENSFRHLGCASDLIAHALDRLDAVAGLAQLLAQVSDVDVHGAALAVKAVAPDLA